MATKAGRSAASPPSASSSAAADSGERGGHSSNETKPPRPMRSATVTAAGLRGRARGLAGARLGGLLVADLAEARGVARGALDDVVRRAVLEQPAVAHAEVGGLGVVGDDRQRRLLGLDGIAARQPQPDALRRFEQPVDLLVLGLLG